MKVTIDEKVIEVRQPTPPEWVEYIGAQRHITRHLEGGLTEEETADPKEAAAVLFRAIRLGDGPDVDGDEAAYAIGELSVAYLTGEIRKDGEQIVFPLAWPGHKEEIRCRKPKVGERRVFARAYQKVTNGPKESTMRFNPSAAVTFFDAVAPERRDAPVPIKILVAAQLFS